MLYLIFIKNLLPMQKIGSVILVLFFFLTSTVCQSLKPNIIIIYVDDLGYGDLSCYGATDVLTPNIDKLANEGMLFTDGHCAAATCTPSRFSLLTGSYAFRYKASILPGDAPLVIPVDLPTLPGMLQSQGYATAVVGKWHLGLGDGNVDWNGKIAPGPLEIGFDYSYLIPATGDRVPCVLVENHHVVGLDPNDPISVDYNNKVGNDPTGYENPELLDYPADFEHAKTIINGVSRIGYMTGGNAARWKDETVPYQMLQKARWFITENKDNPFFLYFAFHDIHVPRMPDQRFKGATKLGPRGDAIVQMDYITGELVTFLEKLNIDENTLIIFSSDNGPVLNDGYADGAAELNTTHKPAGPYRGGKYSAFEAGTRVPTITYWPSVIQPGKSDALLTHVDLYGSIAALIGYKLTKNEAPDSKNMLDAFMGKSETGREFLLEESFTFSLRKGNMKFIAPTRNGPQWIDYGKGIESGFDKSPQLYDLSTDKKERKNIASEHPELVEEFQNELNKIKENNSTRDLK